MHAKSQISPQRRHVARMGIRGLGRTVVTAMVATVGLAAYSTANAASVTAWPEASKPIVFVVPFTPGGANDLVARIFAKKVSALLHDEVLVENRPGAGSVLGAAHVARSKPDGYTFLVGANGTITNSLIRNDQPYKDSALTPVALMGVAPSVIVTGVNNPANDLKQFVDQARAKHAARVTFSTAGVGSTPDFVGAMLKIETGLPVDSIGYKSGSEGVAAVIGGHVDMTSEASIVTLPLVQGGRLKALATTGSHRLASAPNIPTTAEQGFPNIRIGHWEGLFAPTGTPSAILDKMAQAVLEAAQSPDVRADLARSSIEPGDQTRAQFTAFTTSEREHLAQVIKSADMKPEQ